MLRRAVLAVGVVVIAAGVVAAVAGAPWFVWAELLASGTVLVAAILLERAHYRPPRPGPGGGQPTGERFIDPATGRLTEVRYDPATGQRAYVPVEDGDAGSG